MGLVNDVNITSKKKKPHQSSWMHLPPSCLRELALGQQQPAVSSLVYRLMHDSAVLLQCASPSSPTKHKIPHQLKDSGTAAAFFDAPWWQFSETVVATVHRSLPRLLERHKNLLCRLSTDVAASVDPRSKKD